MKMLARARQLIGAQELRSGARIQSLWSGYGEVRRVHAQGLQWPTVVIKHVRPPANAHPRKLRSYQVERVWYEDFAADCGPSCRVPRCLGTWTDGHESLFVLEDLDAAGFSGRRRSLSRKDHDHCLRWLAAFHGTFVGVQPQGLWAIGTYWNLDTRPDELRAMRDPELRRLAPELDAQLNGARFQTLVHGDAKPANFCFASGGRGVAAVDFQYVGGGVGVRDVAYFLEGWRGLRGRERQRYLDLYFEALHDALPAGVDGVALEREWRGLYGVAVRDFERFLDGWR